MRPMTYALIASLTLAAVLAGCTNNPSQSTNNTDQVDGNITVTCPTPDANETSNNTTSSSCPSGNSTSSYG